MVTAQLTEYVKSQLAVGHSSTEIRNALINAGWNISDIDQVIPAPTPSPKVTQPMNALTTFSDFGVTFSYPSAW